MLDIVLAALNGWGKTMGTGALALLGWLLLVICAIYRMGAKRNKQVHKALSVYMGDRPVAEAHYHLYRTKLQMYQLCCGLGFLAFFFNALAKLQAASKTMAEVTIQNGEWQVLPRSDTALYQPTVILMGVLALWNLVVAVGLWYTTPLVVSEHVLHERIAIAWRELRGKVERSHYVTPTSTTSESPPSISP